MTNAVKYRIAQIFSSARDMEELSKLRELEQILMEQVVDKMSTIWVVASKIDKLDDKLKEILYGK